MTNRWPTAHLCLVKPSASCIIPVEDVAKEEFSELTLIDKYKESESDENNNPEDLHAFGSHFDLDKTSRKIFGSVKTVEEVFSCTSFGLCRQVCRKKLILQA